jgi:hypothetical protein
MVSSNSSESRAGLVALMEGLASVAIGREVFVVLDAYGT